MTPKSPEIKQKPSSLAMSDSRPSYGLKRAVLTPIETLAQSIAGIAPSATPGVIVPIVFSFAGNGTWLSYLIATIGMIFTAKCINEFASRSASPGSLYTFVTEGFGSRAGMLTGWALLFAYIFGGSACAAIVTIFATSLTKHFLNLQVSNLIIMLIAIMLVAYIAYKNIKLSATMMLWCECISVALISLLVLLVLGKHGFTLDLQQLSLSGTSIDNVRMGLVLAINGFAAFETAASLGVESAEPLKTIPKAIFRSILFTGLFFVVASYTMVLSFKSLPVNLSTCSTPLLAMAEGIHLPLLGYLIDAGIMVSLFAAGLANLNAASRIVLKMSNDGLFHSSLGRTHHKNSTPHIAVAVCSCFSLSIVVILTALKIPLLDIVGWLGTLGTFGFIYGYLATSISAGKLLKKLGKLGTQKIFVVGISLSVLLLALFGSLYPIPAFPYNLLPFIFIAYMILGLIFCYRQRFNVADNMNI